MQTSGMTLSEIAPALQHLVEAGLDVRPDSAIILGSGFGAIEQLLKDPFSIPYSEIPGFAQPSGTAGHKCRLSIGRLNGKLVALFRGRYHFYENHAGRDLVMPVRLAKALGVKSLLVTNASGGIREDLHSGALMVISDHINMLGVNPLMGASRMEGAPRFPPMAGAYQNQLSENLKLALAACDESVFEGIYAAVSGPSFETAAEVNMLNAIGADTVGMSTVPEVIAAHALGIQVAGLSLITNRAGGAGDSHENTIFSASENAGRIIKVINNWVGRLP